MFSGFMVNAWIAASIVAVVAGVVGFFVVLRGSAFVAHAIPNGAFAGGAGAVLVGVDTIVGLALFSLLGALGIGFLGRRGRQDAVTALALVTLLGLGALFLNLSSEYEPAVYSLFFGEVLGISPTELAPTAALAVVCVALVALLYRPLMLSSVLAEVGEARGVDRWRMEIAFLVVVALATTMTVPVVGTLLIFSLMIGPPAAARSFVDRPGQALCLSVALALATVWAAIALSYTTNYPIGFFVGCTGAALYAIGRLWAALGLGRRAQSAGPPDVQHPTHPPERHTILT
jgi:zinc/manganese transport system permease protein